MYFRDKEDLFHYLVQESIQELLVVFEEILRGRNGDVFAALPDMYDYLRSHPAADCGLGGPGMMSAIVNRNGGLQKGGLLEFVEPEDLGYILRTLIILAVPVMYNGLRPGADPDGRKRLERVLKIVRRGMGAKPASAQQK